MADEDLTIRARIDDELSRPLENIKDNVRDVGREAETSGRRASRASRGWDVLGRATERAGRMARGAAKVTKWALIGIGAGVAALGYATSRLVRSSIGEAREAQKIGRVTEQIIKSTGGTAKVTAKQVANLAGRISEKAGMDDEAIQSGANLLLTFKKVRNEAGKSNKIFDRATQAAVDLSAAGFGSIEGGSKMLGKALNDPLKGITALSRAGVTFTEEQTATIKKLVESNDVLSAQKIILGEVESQVGGVAAAQATFGEKAAVVWGNLQERLGTALLPLLDRFQRWFVQKGGPALDNYIGIFERKGVPAIRRFTGRAKELTTEYLPKAKDLLRDVADVTKTGAGYAKDLVGAFTSMPSWARKAMLGGAAAGIAGKKLGLFSAIKGLSSGAGGIAGLISKAKPMPVFVTNPGFSTGPGGVPGAGGKPGVPVIPGGLPGGGTSLFKGLGKGLMRFGLVGASAAASGWGVAVKGPGTPVAPGQNTAYDKYNAAKAAGMSDEEYLATLDSVKTNLDAARAKAAGFGKELDLVGARKVDPTVKREQIDRANDALYKFIGYQRDAGRPITPLITMSGYERAMGQISTLTAAIHSIPTAGTDNGLTYVGGGSRPPAPAPGGKTPAPRVPQAAPRTAAPTSTGGGTITIERIEVTNPTSNVDVEQAVAAGIRKHERDRKERR